MALGVEFANVIVRVTDAERSLPGGLDRFAASQHNYIEDEHLVRVGFMNTREADDLIGRLRSLGLPDDAVALVQSNAPVPACLRRGEIDGIPAVWLTGHDPGPLVPPLQGVLLRGGSLLRDTLAALNADGDVEVRRTSPDEHAHDRYEIARGEALIDLDLIQGDGTVGVWANRRQDRNRRCRDDIELLEWLRTALEAAGAHS
ncbi:hypothetical protein [Actinomadura sp. 7K507]|uniref:hypothetical protein n=1 Tax=Actinomadura sp. 7K507 TaxID=2530365 RepID=UPI00104B635A|nr:hypothetical protein [Actinomadura sp. 7K507]TDC74480.1 hypothetical protein E1285_43170 [Actinomadura sp. 7K507]